MVTSDQWTGLFADIHYRVFHQVSLPGSSSIVEKKSPTGLYRFLPSFRWWLPVIDGRRSWYRVSLLGTRTCDSFLVRFLSPLEPLIFFSSSPLPPDPRPFHFFGEMIGRERSALSEEEEADSLLGTVESRCCPINHFFSPLFRERGSLEKTKSPYPLHLGTPDFHLVQDFLKKNCELCQLEQLHFTCLHAALRRPMCWSDPITVSLPRFASLSNWPFPLARVSRGKRWKTQWRMEREREREDKKYAPLGRNTYFLTSSWLYRFFFTEFCQLSEQLCSARFVIRRQPSHRNEPTGFVFFF